MKNISSNHGIYEQESDGIRNFCWMAKQASLSCTPTAAFCKFEIGNPGTASAQLTIKLPSSDFDLEILPGWHPYFIDTSLYKNEECELKLMSNANNCVDSDTRELSLMIGDISFVDTWECFYLKDGFYTKENDGIRSFHWMQKEARLTAFARPGEGLTFEAGFPGSFPAKLAVTCNGKTTEFSIINGWQQLAVPFEVTTPQLVELTFRTNARHEAQGDDRELCLMIGSINVGEISNYAYNSYLLHQDLFRSVVTSATPTFFTFETSAICNMKCNMCVVDPKLKRYDLSRIKTSDKVDYLYDQLMPNATKLQLHATGEVLTGKDFWKALDKAKVISQKRPLEIEIFTNGQLLNDENINKILSSPLTDVVISMDAASAKTYSHIRGGDFSNLCNNVRKFIQKNAESGNIRIALGMVLMRENIEELVDFVRLASSLGAKTVTFWPLFAVGMDMPPKNCDDGFVFHYKQQMLINYPNITRAKVEEAYAEADRLGIRIGTTPCFSKDYRSFEYSDLPYPLTYEKFLQMSQDSERIKFTQGEIDSNSLKGCYLPWNTAFITTEGRFSPCLLLTYKGGIDNVLGKDFIKDVWNSQLMQELRQSIINGEPHTLCKNAQCIFVNKLY